MRAVVEAHFDFVWRSLRRLGLAEDAADDAAQQVFCVFARRVGEVASDKEKTFLFGVVLRVAQASRRAQARRPEVTDDHDLAQLAAPESGPDERVDEQRAREILDALLEAMPLDLRTVFVLHEIEELTMADIATMLEMPPGTVASRLRRARAEFDELARKARKRGVR